MSQVRDEVREWLRGIKGVTCYTEKMKIYAPTCDGKCLPAVEKLIDRINLIFKGSTVYDAVGTWVEDERVEKEPVKVIEVGHRCADPETARAFADAIVDYAAEADQQSIAIHQSDFYIAETPEMLRAYRRIKREIP